MLSTHTIPYAIRIFFGYALEDEGIQKQLRAHFATLRQQGLIHDWDLSCIRAGQNSEEEIEKQLKTAQIILLLISVHFMNSESCYSMMMHAMERYHKGEVTVLPILLSPIDITGAPFSDLRMLPEKDRPVISWEDYDTAYAFIALEIRKIVEDRLGWNESLKNIRKTHSTEKDTSRSCPYLGAKPYTESDAHLFFGRETYVNNLLYQLSCDQRLLLVLGPPASGKTSVIQAGVLPQLRQGNKIIPRSCNWEIRTCIPGKDPSSYLLSLLGIHETEELVEGVKRWKRYHPQKERLVLILDQFEELFRVAPPEEQKRFIAQLLKLIIHDVASIILLMSDLYYSDLAEHVDFVAIAEQHISNIPPLQLEEIMTVIQKPAQAVGLDFEGHLPEKIADDTLRSVQEPKERRNHRQSSVLPNLSICLTQMYERSKNHVMTFDDYDAIGQITGALTLWATQAFHTFDEKQSHLAQRILVDLVALGDDSEGCLDSRRQKTLTMLCYSPHERQDVRDVVEKLAQAHVLETHLNEQRDLAVTIVHESLLREWSLLRHWLREDRLFLLWYQEFEHHREKWVSSNTFIDQRDISSPLKKSPTVQVGDYPA